MPATENARKVIAKMSSLHARIDKIGQDACRQFTSNLTRRLHSIVIKDLNGEGILKSHPLARSIADGSVFEFWRQLEYKAEWWGWPIAGLRPAIPLWLGGKGQKKIPLTVRLWTCLDCGSLQDWEVNATSNHLGYGLAVLAALWQVLSDVKYGERKALAVVATRRRCETGLEEARNQLCFC
ncbi:hypothetical protein A7D33_02355 [Candidatus Methylacidiphilum fumarolicum]|nr:hypothetical protein A7D33_02355 [Candidatus Methylacidiphilum fumarolicum]